ncbi:hypothetical protein DPMN_156795 [Dreissena polymorpha]|uniref:Uncharacterized protein n=1 Tax=Dreissena polymorpha TaxID=45954 RepID=A0A9D4FQH2_DREPO|nr:hypothetical protein DPMN_156795 [Dreissena polymorpha]
MLQSASSLPFPVLPHGSWSTSLSLHRYFRFRYSHPAAGPPHQSRGEWCETSLDDTGPDETWTRPNRKCCQKLRGLAWA